MLVQVWVLESGRQKGWTWVKIASLPHVVHGEHIPAAMDPWWGRQSLSPSANMPREEWKNVITLRHTFQNASREFVQVYKLRTFP